MNTRIFILFLVLLSALERRPYDFEILGNALYSSPIYI